MKSFLYILFYILLILTIFALVFLLSRSIYTVVMNSNMPDWLKYVLLR